MQTRHALCDYYLFEQKKGFEYVTSQECDFKRFVDLY